MLFILKPPLSLIFIIHTTITRIIPTMATPTMAIPTTAIPTLLTLGTGTTVCAAAIHEADHFEAAGRQTVALAPAVEGVAGLPPEVEVEEVFGDACVRCATLVYLARDRHASRDVISSWNGLPNMVRTRGEQPRPFTP